MLWRTIRVLLFGNPKVVADLYPKLVQCLEVEWLKGALHSIRRLLPGKYKSSIPFNPASLTTPQIVFALQANILRGWRLDELPSRLNDALQFLTARGMPVDYQRSELRSPQPGNFLGTALEFITTAWLIETIEASAIRAEHNHGQIQGTTVDLVARTAPDVMMDIKARAIVQSAADLEMAQIGWEDLAKAYPCGEDAISLDWLSAFEALPGPARKAILSTLDAQIRADVASQSPSRQWDSGPTPPYTRPLVIVKREDLQMDILGPDSASYLISTISKLMDKPHQLSRTHPNIRVLVGYHMYSHIFGDPYYLTRLGRGDIGLGVTGAFAAPVHGPYLSGILYIPVSSFAVEGKRYWIPNAAAAHAVPPALIQAIGATAI